MLRPRVRMIIVAVALALVIQVSDAERKIAQAGVKAVQVPFQSLKPSATFKIGNTADWVLVTKDAVWVGGSKPYSVQRIDPSTDKIVAKIGDGTVSRVDTATRNVTATIAVGIPGVGGEICYGADSVWTAKFGIPLTRIDAKTNTVSRQWVGRGGDAVRFGFNSIWLTDYHRGLLWRIPFSEETA